MTKQRHHWWPESIQKQYWQDANNRVHWIEPDGRLDYKNPENHRTGSNLRHHTIDQINWNGDKRPQPLHYLNGANFENDFQIDNNVHKVVALTRELAQSAKVIPPSDPLAQITFKQNLSEVRWTRHEQSELNQLMAFCLSLLVRSPANQFRLKKTPTIANLPENLAVGKQQMRAQFKNALSILEGSTPRTFLPTILLSDTPNATFLFADGLPDCLTGSLFDPQRLTAGHALVPLTPNICIFVSTSEVWTSQRNCAVLRVSSAAVQRINLLTQVYARDKLFYKGEPPKLTEEFRRHEHLELVCGSDPMFDALNEALS
jgi:hypothetical protein